jgi:hypothetical protein
MMGLLLIILFFAHFEVLQHCVKIWDIYFNNFCRIGVLKHEFYKTYIKIRVRFAARLLQGGVPVNDECSEDL